MLRAAALTAAALLESAATHLLAVQPLLVTAHLMAFEHFDWPMLSRDVKTEVICHDFLTYCVRKHLQ